ncbi:hypothetical protein VPHK409_0024 [Vibrio phage K409]
MLTRINDVHKLHQVVQFHIVQECMPVSITPVIRDNGITLEYRVRGELIAEERKLTAVMAEQVWHARYKSDHVWVDEDAFRRYAGNGFWNSLSGADLWTEYRRYGFKLEEVQDERALV